MSIRMQISRMTLHERMKQSELRQNLKKRSNPYSWLNTLLQAPRLGLTFYCGEPALSAKVSEALSDVKVKLSKLDWPWFDSKLHVDMKLLRLKYRAEFEPGQKASRVLIGGISGADCCLTASPSGCWTCRDGGELLRMRWIWKADVCFLAACQCSKCDTLTGSRSRIKARLGQQMAMSLLQVGEMSVRDSGNIHYTQSSRTKPDSSCLFSLQT